MNYEKGIADIKEKLDRALDVFWEECEDYEKYTWKLRWIGFSREEALYHLIDECGLDMEEIGLVVCEVYAEMEF